MALDDSRHSLLPSNNKKFQNEEIAVTNRGYVSDKNDQGDIVLSDGRKETRTPYQDDADVKVSHEEENHWKITNDYVKGVPWSELPICGKFKRVLWGYFGKLVVLIGLLYLFICSLDFLSNAFKLIGGKAAGSAFAESQVLSNPVAGLMIGILATALLQSSSATTSIVVSMVAARIIPESEVPNVIPVVMGANIGTSVTDTLVSITQIANKNDFRRAFAGATVYDMFNWLTVIILLPVEALTGYLFRLSKLITNRLNLQTKTAANLEFLKKLTQPFTNLIIQVDKKVMNKSMIKHCCGNTSENWNTSGHRNYSYTATERVCQKCKFLFEGVSWSDTTIGIVLLVIALVMLCVCLVLIVKILHSFLKGKITSWLKMFVNADFPGNFAYFTGYLAILVGMGLTILVQSSSVFTSALTALVGIRVISVDRMYPLTLGANIGTTTTALLAALAQSAEDIPLALQISLCHLLFNISGMLLFFPIPYLRFPIRMAKALGNVTAEYRWFPIAYLLFGFFLLPGAVLGLSLISWEVMAAVCSPIAFLLVVIVAINILQNKAPTCLPNVLRTWAFLPEPLRSLKPIDRQLQKLKIFCNCCCRSKEANTETNVTGKDRAEYTKF
ncbi:sodium-dependent phosphate transport protein 2B-like [Mercenaria mercenaria]|uniref:sodium-dependent phosphate transport protein 2B-like n=1 Tax=Mercenaria mercenaria TaxID=6596 RepID=UPI00234F791A|nr:sodium-dependent phosphate transport protein 2B-like [Mercenaria mercenaria]XP_053376135.1 sodium-dependent phosphate transport protein 2B-like [Mercenaria mercenaria]XP_053376138.1 sodium-dependent phosphate transport protein 2B-like [Mercenaria mercenaria]XP_053376142.1 sodium-dependent phosphate transport protein 2B-like [Mercenaria mercenaria]